MIQFFRQKIYISIFIYTCVFIIAVGGVYDFIVEKAEAIPTTTTTYYVPVFVKTGGVIQSGQTVYVGVFKYYANIKYWYDFDDSTFKTTGWTTQNETASWNTTNAKQHHYYFIFNKPAGEPVNQVYYSFASTDAGVRMCDAKALSFEQIQLITGP